MADWHSLVGALAHSPLFGLTVTLLAYTLAIALFHRFDHSPWVNPVLCSVLPIIGLLLATGIAYEDYFAGAQFIHFLLGPAVVALAWPMWQQRRMLWQYKGAMLAAALAGGVVGCGSAVLLGWALGLPATVLLSLAPKAITSPVAIGIAQTIDGIAELAALFVLLTGLFGAIGGRYIFNALGIRAWTARGFALGAQAHGFGTARALQVHPEAGAFAGVALGVMAVLGSVLIPLLVALLR